MITLKSLIYKVSRSPALPCCVQCSAVTALLYLSALAAQTALAGTLAY